MPTQINEAAHRYRYTSLAEDLLRFQDLQHMPMGLSLNMLNDGDGVETTRRAHSVQWHQKCRLKVNKKMFDQQSLADVTTGQQTKTHNVHTRSAHSHTKSKEPTCFFCDEPAGSAGLHAASTYKIDKNIRMHAQELEDTDLLTKLPTGDMIALGSINCLGYPCNRARQAAHEDDGGDDDRLHGIAGGIHGGHSQ